ncbi:MAG: 4Fe-4S dicluster domain-containing protein [Candidatus Kapaibacteriales bacterium]
MDRRDFLNLLISSSIVFQNSCQRKSKFFVPKVKEIAGQQINDKLHFATTFPHKLLPLGVIIETYKDKPYRIQRNENHPHNNGFLPMFVLPSLYNLYDPFRFFNPLIEQKELNIDEALDCFLGSVSESISKKKDIIFVIQDILSPTLFKLISEIKTEYQNFYFYAIPNVDLLNNQLVANQILYDSSDFLLVDFSDADVILNIGSDFLSSDYFSSFYLSKLRLKKYTLITIESTLSLTGMNSNYRYALPESEYPACLLSILGGIGNSLNLRWLNEIIDEIQPQTIYSSISQEILNILRLNKKIKVIVDPLLHPLIHIIGYILESLINSTPFVERWIIPLSDSKSYFSTSYLDFQAKIYEKKFGTIVFFDSNPFEWTYKGVSDIVAQIKKNNCFVFSYYPTNFQQLGYNCIPTKNYLEYWGDYLNIDYSISVQQPIVYPLNKNSASLNEVLLLILRHLRKEQNYKTFFDFFKSFYIENFSCEDDFFSSISNGLMLLPNVKHRPTRFILNNSKITKVLALLKSKLFSEKFHLMKDDEIYLSLKISSKFFDGSYSNNPYLCELPDPIFGVSWDDFLILNERTANKLELNDNDVVLVLNELTNKSIELPVVVSNSVALSTGFIYLGTGEFYKNLLQDHKGTNKLEVVNTQFEKIDFINQNFYYHNPNTIVKIEKLGKKTLLSKLQSSSKISSGTQLLEMLNRYDDKTVSIYFSKAISEKWKLIIDIDKCIGCNLCLLACQLENNIPLVGPKEIQKQRDLFWIRVEKYQFGNGSKQFYFLPIMCQQCDIAPCEAVCPVGATSHSDDGINEMTYNRCIGSRICMINCPYEVRRFNFDRYKNFVANTLSEFKNPDVTVRTIGVSEKCNFCVHRLRESQKNEKNFQTTKIHSLSTACQDACPMNAITLTKTKKEENNSTFKILLAKFNTKPNVLYQFTLNEKS